MFRNSKKEFPSICTLKGNYLQKFRTLEYMKEFENHQTCTRFINIMSNISEIFYCRSLNITKSNIKVNVEAKMNIQDEIENKLPD